MPASYTTAEEVDAFIGTRERQAIVVDENGDYDAAAFARLINVASTYVRTSVLRGTGRDLGDTTTDEFARQAASALAVRFIYSRASKDPPEDMAMLINAALEGIRSGLLPMPQTPADKLAGRGGSGSADSCRRVFRDLGKLM
jgi:hypothetical protein